MDKLTALLKQGKGDTFFIAEIGVNHESSISRAKRMIDEVSEIGLDSAKFQAYTADELAVIDSPAYWDLSEEKTTTQYELFSKYSTFKERDYRVLSEHCTQKGIVFSCTSFGLSTLEMIDPLVGFHKVSSSDINNIPFIKAIAKKGKPILLSTGAVDGAGEIVAAIDAVRSVNKVPICLMHCVLSYPTLDADANLGFITMLKQRFPDFCIGYSDHTKADEFMSSVAMAYSLGARVIEKHYTDNKQRIGNDHYHSMDRTDARRMIEHVATLKLKSGNEVNDRHLIPSELAARANARRSLVTSRRVAAGEILSEENVTFKRPGTGISVSDWDRYIRKFVFAKDLDADKQFSTQDVVVFK